MKKCCFVVLLFCHHIYATNTQKVAKSKTNGNQSEMFIKNTFDLLNGRSYINSSIFKNTGKTIINGIFINNGVFITTTPIQSNNMTLENNGSCKWISEALTKDKIRQNGYMHITGTEENFDINCNISSKTKNAFTEFSDENIKTINIYDSGRMYNGTTVVPDTVHIKVDASKNDSKNAYIFCGKLQHTNDILIKRSEFTCLPETEAKFVITPSENDFIEMNGTSLKNAQATAQTYTADNFTLRKKGKFVLHADDISFSNDANIYSEMHVENINSQEPNMKFDNLYMEDAALHIKKDLSKFTANNISVKNGLINTMEASQFHTIETKNLNIKDGSLELMLKLDPKVDPVQTPEAMRCDQIIADYCSVSNGNAIIKDYALISYPKKREFQVIDSKNKVYPEIVISDEADAKIYRAEKGPLYYKIGALPNGRVELKVADGSLVLAPESELASIHEAVSDAVGLEAIATDIVEAFRFRNHVNMYSNILNLNKKSKIENHHMRYKVWQKVSTTDDKTTLDDPKRSSIENTSYTTMVGVDASPYCVKGQSFFMPSVFMGYTRDEILVPEYEKNSKTELSKKYNTLKQNSCILGGKASWFSKNLVVELSCLFSMANIPDQTDKDIGSIKSQTYTLGAKAGYKHKLSKNLGVRASIAGNVGRTNMKDIAYMGATIKNKMPVTVNFIPTVALDLSAGNFSAEVSYISHSRLNKNTATMDIQTDESAVINMPLQNKRYSEYGVKVQHKLKDKVSLACKYSKSAGSKHGSTIQGSVQIKL